MCQQNPGIVDQHKLVPFRCRDPNQFESNPSQELHVRYIPGWIFTTPQSTRCPTPSWTKVREGRDPDSRPQSISTSNARDTRSIVFVVGVIITNARQIDMIVIIKGMTRVPLSRHGIGKVAQTTGPQQSTPNVFPRMSTAQRPIFFQLNNACASIPHPRNRCPGVDRIDLIFLFRRSVVGRRGDSCNGCHGCGGGRGGALLLLLVG